MSAISVTAPMAYQTIQRNGSNQADIAIAGTYTYASSGHIEASWNGGSYTRIATIADGTDVSFSGTLSSQATGQGTLTVRIEEEPATSATNAYVGIGDVIACGGQSNMDGQGNNLQSYSHPTLKPTNFKSSTIGGDNAWHELVDPYHPSSGGSIAPLFATLLMAATGVPVGFIPMSAGGTSLFNWVPGSFLGGYENTITPALNAAGPARAMLWWQGESDVNGGTSTADYEDMLNQLANGLWTDFALRLVPAKLQTISAYPDENEAAIRAAIANVWASNVHVIPGVDLVSLDEGIHITSDAGLQFAAEQFYAAYANAFIQADVTPRFSSVFSGVLR